MTHPTIDYTTMRKGTRITRTRTIQYCPKCGRKGEQYPAHTDPSGRHWPARYCHKAEDWGWCLSVTDLCVIDEPTQEVTP